MMQSVLVLTTGRCTSHGRCSGIFMVAGTLLGMGTSWYLYKVRAHFFEGL